MNTTSRTGRRIVSKGEYASTLGKKAALSMFGISISLIGSIGLFTTLAAGVSLNSASEERPLITLLAFVLGGISTFFVVQGIGAILEAKRIDSGVPLTRANTADLPAPDSLVRASTEPIQAQEAVLLRAVTIEQERHAEQLLRAVAENQE